jgi:hypothetical protein
MLKRTWPTLVACLLLANGMLGLAPSLWRLVTGQEGAVPWLALLGVAAGALSLRGWRAAVWAGALFYAVQVCSFYSYAGSWSFSMKAGLSLAWVQHLEQGVLVVNLAAVALLAASLRLARRPLCENARFRPTG